jgi:hypothetical protein
MESKLMFSLAPSHEYTSAVPLNSFRRSGFVCVPVTGIVTPMRRGFCREASIITLRSIKLRRASANFRFLLGGIIALNEIPTFTVPEVLVAIADSTSRLFLTRWPSTLNTTSAGRIPERATRKRRAKITYPINANIPIVFERIFYLLFSKNAHLKTTPAAAKWFCFSY